MKTLNLRYARKYDRAIANAGRLKAGSRRWAYWIRAASRYRMIAVKTLGMAIP
jgi:hypothetical protein